MDSPGSPSEPCSSTSEAVWRQPQVDPDDGIISSSDLLTQRRRSSWAEADDGVDSTVVDNEVEPSIWHSSEPIQNVPPVEPSMPQNLLQYAEDEAPNIPVLPAPLHIASSQAEAQNVFLEPPPPPPPPALPQLVDVHPNSPALPSAPAVSSVATAASLALMSPASIYDNPIPGPSSASASVVGKIDATISAGGSAAQPPQAPPQPQPPLPPPGPSLLEEDDDDDDPNVSFPPISVDDLEDLQLHHLLSEEPLPLSSIIRDTPVPSRAKASLPTTHLFLEEIGASPKVMAKIPLQAGTRFGPAEGLWRRKASASSIPASIDENTLMIFSRGKESTPTADVLDMSDENRANWMRFVCRLEPGEYEPDVVNTELRPEGNEIFYCLTKALQPGEELILGLSKEYCSKRERFFKHKRGSSQSGVKTLLPDVLFAQQQQQRSQEEFALCRKCHLRFPNGILCSFHHILHGYNDRPGSVSLDRDSSSLLDVSCPACQAVFPSLVDLSAHVTQDHALLDCKLEHESLAEAATTQEEGHSKKHTHKCQMCYKAFSSIERLQRHALVHSRDESKPLGCGICGRRFLNLSALSCHQKSHQAEKSYDCPICKMPFAQIVLLKEHVHTHKNEDGTYTCPACQKTFNEYSSIRKHIRALHVGKNFTCHECGKAFSSSSKLGLHRTVHSQEKSFQCSNCGKCFGRKDKLKEHIARMHTAKREKAATQQPDNGPEAEGSDNPTEDRQPADMEPKQPKNALNSLQPAATDYKMFVYKCHECLLGFKRRGMLVNHLAKRHPDTPPSSVPELNLPILKVAKDYACQHCHKVYKSSSKRKIHILKKHPGEEPPRLPQVGAQEFATTVGSITLNPHSCNACHKQYASRAKLLQHQRKMHPVQAMATAEEGPATMKHE